MSQSKSMQQVLDEFKCLNNKDPGTWLPIPRLFVLTVVFVGVVLLGVYAFWSGQWDELDRAVVSESQLKDQWKEAKRTANNLDVYRRQLEEIDRAFGSLLKQLPSRSEIETLLVEVNQAGLGRGLQFDLFKPDAEQVKEFYAELPINVRVSGSYNDLGMFVSDIARLPRIVTLNDIDLATGQPAGQLAMNVRLRTFRYLDADELPKGGRK